MAGSLAGLDDLDSDLLGSLGRKKVTSPRNKPGKDSDTQDKHPDVRRRTSSGSLHRKGSVTPFSEDEIGVLDNNLMLSDNDDNDDVLNSSMNSTTSKHRKVSPNKISPRVNLENMPEGDTKSKKPEKASRSKEVDFDSDSDLPGLDNKEAESAVKKKPSSKRRKAKKSDHGDLFGDDDDLPDLDSPAKSGKTKAASALDSLMGKKSKSSTPDTKKTKPATLDDFMAKVSTTSKTSPKSEIQSPVRSPSSEETFQFGGYMPSSAGRKSRGNTRPDSETGRRSVKFSDGLGLDDDMFSSKKRPSTAPGSRRKKDEPKDPLNNTFTASSNKDKADWLGLDDKTDSGNSGKAGVDKDEDLSPQTSLQGSKSSMSGDWLGLGDDVTDDQLNASLTPVKSPESDQGTVLPEKKQDDELSKMLDLVPNGAKNKSDSVDKSLFPWEGGKAPGRRRRRGTASSATQDGPDVLRNETESEKRTSEVPETKVQTKSTPQRASPVETSTPIQNQTPGKEFGPSVVPSFPGPQQPGRVSAPVSSDRTPFYGSDVGHVTPHQAGFNASQYRSELNKQNYEVELKGMIGKIHDVENEKYKVEMDMANRLAELETK
ncbi:Hypothetical predicted protein, partial [Paramuricea clavata]